MNRTISPAAVILSVGFVALTMITAISAARSVSAEHEARQCVARGISPAQCWENASPTF